MAPPRDIRVVSSATEAELYCAAHICWPTQAVPELLSHHAIVAAWKGGNIVKVIHAIQTENGHEVRKEELDLGDYIEQRKVHRYDYNPQDVYEPHEVLERARSKLGNFEYCLYTNNCEHFVCWCKYNVNESSQVSTAKKAAAASSAVAVSSSVVTGAIVAAVVLCKK